LKKSVNKKNIQIISRAVNPV